MKRKIFCSMLTAISVLSAAADEITTVPSPAVTTKALQITVNTKDLGSEVYCYTWAIAGEQTVEAAAWAECNVPKHKMSGSGGTYTFAISNIQEFYGMTDAQLESLTKLGFIAKNNSGQSADLMVDVIQGRRNFYSGGEGSATNPFVLKTRDDMLTLSVTSGDWEAEYYFVMDADIEVGEFAGIGSKGSPFKAHFDGRGHVLSGVVIDGSEVLGAATGVFNAIDGASVKNLAVSNAEVRGTTFTGALVGLAISGSVSSCYTSGSVTGSSICTGGLIGENAGAAVSDCYSTASVSNPGDYAVGGLVGKNKGSVKNTFAAGSVKGFNYAGGLIGANYGTVANSVAMNAGMDAPAGNNYVARFGGNNNSRNNNSNNMSWFEMPVNQSAWGTHGHHATGHTHDLVLKDTYAVTLGWNFENVWEWKTAGTKQYPALKGIGGQENAPCSDNFYEILAGIDDMTMGNGGVKVFPNPVVTVLEVRSAAPVASYTLTSLSGAVVMSGNSVGTSLSVDMGNVAPGMYFLTTVSADGNTVVNKIIKK